VGSITAFQAQHSKETHQRPTFDPKAPDHPIRAGSLDEGVIDPAAVNQVRAIGSVAPELVTPSSRTSTTANAWAAARA
jgi:hypothetical protein